MKILNCITLLTFVLVIFSQPVFSQDHHYWSQQFGSRSVLMSGAVVGGVRDTSAGFYNPGALGFVDQPSLSVSANAYQLESLSIDNGIGTDSSLDSEKISIIPLLASGTLIFDLLPNHTFGYSLLAKNNTSIDTSGRVEKNIEVIGDINHADDTVSFQGEENYIGQVIASSEVTELWGGLSWANQVRPNISVGATAFMAFRNQTQNRTITARAANGSRLASVDQLDYIDFWNIRLLLKLGIAAEFDALKLGMTVTTPSRNLFGQATVAGEDSFNNKYDPVQDKFFGKLVSNRQENLDTTYKTPVSIALGFEYAVAKKTNIAGTVEWFAEQSKYDVITPGSHSFLRNIIVDEMIAFDESLEERELLKVKDGAESVINFAVAIEHDLTNITKAYLGFRVDHETNPNSTEGHSLGITNWDIYHITAGATFERKRSELAVGLTYSIGSSKKNFMQFANFANVGDGSLLGEPQDTTTDYDALSLIVGYTYFFSKR